MLFVRTLVLLGCAVCLMAQSDTPQSGAQEPDTSQPETAQASSNDEYTGPAILSRGETPSQQGAIPVAFRPYIGLNAIYQTGLIPVSVTSAKQIPTSDLFGLELNLGAYTYRAWEHTTLGLDYRGDFREYSQSYWDGTDQSISLILTHRPNSRVTFTLRATGGVYALNSYTLASPLGGLDPNFLQSPQNNIYDNRVIFANTAGDLTYRLTRRWSFNIGAEGGLVRRQSSALYGNTDATARADLEYRLSRHTTIGVDYTFRFYDYTKGFGNTYINSTGFNYSTQVSRHLQFSARVGGARVESSSLTVVTLAPSVAALLGESTAIQAAYHLHYIPDAQARLTETYQHSSFSLSYLNQVTPGNGVYLTSRNNSGMASYSFAGLQHWNFSANVNYGRISGLVQTLGEYATYGAGVGLTRDLTRSLHAVLRVDASHFDVSGSTAFLHTEYRSSLGITFSPGNVPLVLW